MTHVRASTVPDEAPSAQDGVDSAEGFSRTLDGWRGRIDELVVQVDLAQLDAREDLGRHLEATENAYLAIRSRLSDAYKDVGSSGARVRQGVEQLLRDLRWAYDDAEAALTRGRNESESSGA